MISRNDSGTGGNGKATLTDLGNGQTKVTINLTMVAGGGLPAYIISGTCAGQGQIKYHLTDITNGLLTNTAPGSSETILNVSFKNIQSSLPLAIAVRYSQNTPPTYLLSCGDLH